MKNGIECPHCKETLSKEYTVKALSLLAKSEGHDFDEELEALAEGEVDDGLDEEVEQEDTGEAEKGVKRGKKAGVSGPTNYAGNKTASHRGQAPGTFHSSSRARSGEPVQRTNHPTNPVTEGGVKKSINVPVIIGEPRLVEYGYGEDASIAKSIEEGTAHVPSMRNLQMEQELANGDEE